MPVIKRTFIYTLITIVFRLGVVVIPINRSLEIDTQFDLQAARLLAPLLDTPKNVNATSKMVKTRK